MKEFNSWNDVKVGDTIKIINMDDAQHYNGRVGIVEKITTDPWNDVRFEGTWGGFALYPEVDLWAKVVPNEKEENDKKVLWNGYIKYLQEWAKESADSKFYGMSPACFDEWLDNEHAEEEED